MSIEELLKYNAAGLEAMTLEDKKKFFEPYLKFIVPVAVKEERVNPGIKSSGGTRTKSKPAADVEKMLQLSDRLAKQLGLKI